MKACESPVPMPVSSSSDPSNGATPKNKDGIEGDEGQGVQVSNRTTLAQQVQLLVANLPGLRLGFRAMIYLYLKKTLKDSVLASGCIGLLGTHMSGQDLLQVLSSLCVRC